MAVMHLGLVVSALGFLYVGWASWSAGYTPEVAAVRALVAFMALSFVAYIGQLIVVTQPPKPAVAEEAAAEDAEQIEAPIGRPQLEIVPPTEAQFEPEDKRLAA